MNKLKLLDFQEKVVKEALIKMNGKRGSFVFQAPTGTGKTFISANIINKFIEILPNYESFTFLHFSPSRGKLNEQNAEKFESYNKLANLNRYKVWKLSSSKQMNIKSFERNVIHFFGWDQLIKKTNTITKDSEKNSWYNVFENTLKNKTKIVIIIDEQHLNKNAKITDKFLEEIKKMYDNVFHEDPIYLEMSATIKEGLKKDYVVKYSEAVAEELVKKEIFINKDMSFDENTEEEMIIHSALDKRQEVIKAYNKRNLQKKGKYPLVVIQLPDARQTNKDSTLSLNKIKEYVLSHKTTHKNHVAVWTADTHSTLDGDKIVKKDIESNEDIHVLIFKQAVSTGWDIPRANIWVKLRNNMDKTFETQTLGRVLRNQFRKYYNNDLIDNAFIYTNDEKIKNEIEESYSCSTSDDNKNTTNVKKEKRNNRKQ